MLICDTDSIQLSYRGRLILIRFMPMVMFFDQTFVADAYSSETAKPTKTTVNYGWIDGFTTALLGMHVGYDCRYSSANLAYGSSANSTVPAYSMLRFEWH